MSDLTPEQISLLADKLLKGTISPEERVLFEKWYNTLPEEAIEWNDEDVHSREELQQRMLSPMLRHIKGEKTIVRKWYWAAASILTLFIVGSIYHYYTKGKKEQLLAGAQSAEKSSIVPGRNKATLTLANGNVIVLEDEHNGTLAKQGAVQIIKLNNGQLAYKDGEGENAGKPVSFNTLSTPRGGQYQVTLPDGTVVWMNAASKLIFPTAFNGKDRTVKLMGEAYFEVAANDHQPFIVSVNNMEVKVLGTHFNVMAYEEDRVIKTTLLQGMVKVAGNNKEVLLKPGQQAKMKIAGEMNVVPVNVEEAIAWKNGIFSFNDVTIEEVMQQIARWYDAEVVYPDGVPKGLFRGEIDRTADISTVLKILEVSGVKFTVEGRKILVRA
jgi:ferric-dicitrate binding protein FerR (iron transport regulator)